MGTGFRKTLLAAVTTVVLAATPAAAQTVSQLCADAVRRDHSDVGAVWVTRALTRGDVTELDWSSASKIMGTCTLDATGKIVDVSVTGRRVSEPMVIDESVKSAALFEPYRVTCASEEGTRVECQIRPSAEVELVEVLDDADCEMDAGWGHDEDVVWVDGGCRAVFEIRPARVPMTVIPPGGSGTGELRDVVGPGELRTLEGRAQDACMRAARGRGIDVTHVFGTRAEGSYVVVLMAVQSWAQKADVTCRYDPANDQAAIAR